MGYIYGNAEYESKEFTVLAGAANYSMKTNVAGAFVNVPQAHVVVIRTDQTITAKLNKSTNDPITITASEGSFTFDGTEITDIFISVPGGSNAGVKVVLA